MERFEPRLIHDGIEELGHLPPGQPIELTCPHCRAGFNVDPILMAQSARDLSSSAEDRATLAHLSKAFEWPIQTLDEFVYVRGHRGLSPQITERSCPTCGRALWIVTSTGELQPGRNATAIEGVIAPPPVTRSELGWGLLSLIVAVGFIVALNAAAAHTWFGYRSLAENGVETVATVTGVSSSELPGQADQFWVSYGLPPMRPRKASSSMTS